MDTAVHTVNELLSILKKYQAQFGQSCRSGDFIFRGMSDKKWPLLPGLFRKYPEPQKSSVVVGGSFIGSVYSASESEIIAHFKKEASGFLPHISQTNDFIWMQYAQHFGVPTRLLDFTANPLAALYFCCRSESTEDGVIWIVNTSPFQRWSQSERFCLMLGPDCTREIMIDSIMKGIKGYGNYDEELLEKQLPILFVPAYIDQRMSAQSSRFLLWGKNQEPLDKMISESNSMCLLPENIKYGIADDQRFLASIIISGKSKHFIMRDLDLLGVNGKTIFPGLDGIGHYLERYYRNNVDDMCDFF